jgi:putative transposase
VESEKYLFTLYRYIEMHPVKAKMVKDIADYLWSSYQHNALGEEDSLIAEHELYLGLAESSALRAEHYQQIFESLSTSNQEQQITETTMKGEVYGTDGFYHKISQLISRVKKLTTHGGDRKSESYNNQAG